MKNLFFLSLFLFLLSCGGDDDFVPQNTAPTPTPDPILTPVTGIGSSGGTVNSDDGIIKVIIPEGALNSNVDIKIEKADVTSPANDDRAKDFGDGYKLLPSGTKFNYHVTIEMSYSELPDQKDISDVAAGHWDDQDNFEFLMITDLSDKKLSFELKSFSNIKLHTIEPSDYSIIYDRNFEQALIDYGADDARDGFILTAVAEEILLLDLRAYGIRNFKGLEYFVNVSQIFMDSNTYDEETGYYHEIINIDLSKNSNLLDFTCQSNYIKSIDLTNNTHLRKAYLNNNNLSSIDLSQNIELEHLNIWNNNLESINVSQNKKLERLAISDNKLKSIDLSNCNSLNTISINENPLVSLDLSDKPNLEIVAIGSSKYNAENISLSSIDLYNSPNIKSLGIDGAQLSSIDISHLDHLESLSLYNNQLQNFEIGEKASLIHLSLGRNVLTSLDVSKFPNLISLAIGDNLIKSIDLSMLTYLTHFNGERNGLTTVHFPDNMKLVSVDLRENSLTSLDFSKHPKLEHLLCNNNFSLKELNLKNGNNKNLEFISAYFNYALDCIQVDDKDYRGENWTFDDDVRLSTNCGY